MANRIVSVTTQTPTASADTTNLVDATFPFLIRGGTVAQRINIKEVYLGGQAGSSAPSIMILAYSSTVGTGANSNGTGQTDSATDPATVAIVAPVLTGNTNATSKPQRSSTLHLHNFSFNAFGGIVKWNPGTPDQAPAVLSNTASLGEVTLSAFTGGTTGLMGAHAVYESL